MTIHRPNRGTAKRRLGCAFGWLAALAVAGACSADQASDEPLVNNSIELFGENCPAGGIRVETGIDSDGNGNLDAAEVDEVMFACNAEGPEPGSEQLIDIQNEDAGENCAGGGLAVHTGLDNGDGEAIADDGILQVSERDQSHYVCNPVDAPELISSLTFDNCMMTAANTDPNTYDYPRGNVVLTDTEVLVGSHMGLRSFIEVDMSSMDLAADRFDALFADRASRANYSLSTDGVAPYDRNGCTWNEPIAFTHMLEIDGTMAIIGAIPLSENIVLANGCDSFSIFSGEGFALVSASSVTSKLDLPSGMISDLGVTAPNVYGCSGVGTGIVDFDGTDYTLFYPEYSRVLRTKLGTLVTKEIADLDVRLPDVSGFQVYAGNVCGMALDPDKGRWYFQTYGYNSTTSTSSTIAASCDANF